VAADISSERTVFNCACFINQIKTSGAKTSGAVPTYRAIPGGPPLSADAAALLLVDHQVGLFSLVGDYGPDVASSP
jgi:hypothetical protein